MKSFLESISQFQVESRNPIQSLFNSHSQSGYNSHSHVISLSPSFKSEVFRWINHWKRQSVSDEYISVPSLLAKSTDNIFFPNGRQLLKILFILLMGEHGCKHSGKLNLMNVYFGGRLVSATPHLKILDPHLYM